MTIKNVVTRTEAVKALMAMPKGDSILLAPYNPGAYQQESSSLKAVACKFGIKVELKKALIVIEGEISQPYLRVSRVDAVEMDKRDRRNALRDEAAALLEQAEAMLAELAASYTEEEDGKFSACHPRNGFDSTLRQVEKLRKPLARAKV
ncbi:hypothetical protein UXN85_20685 [Enterobacter hormaechei]